MTQFNKLIYKFSDSPADCARETWDTMARHEDVREEIVGFIESEIVPLYDGFDPAHRRDHVMTVMSQAMELYSRAPENVKKEMDREVLLMAAACHDLGLVNGRENHHLDSGKIIRSDERLRKWFDDGQIETIGKSEPRSIYGKMVAEADRVIDGETIIRRTLQYGQSRYPEMDPEAQIARAEEHLKTKYGYGGYMKLWIPWSDNAARLDALRALIADPVRLHAEVRRIYFTIM